MGKRTKKALRGGRKKGTQNSGGGLGFGERSRLWGDLIGSDL